MNNQNSSPDAFAAIDENSSFNLRNSITFSCKIAKILPLSPIANFHGKVRLICCDKLSGNEYLLLRYLRAFLIVPVLGKIILSFLHRWNTITIIITFITHC